MANLGTLTLDLLAKIGGFTGPLDKAGRESKKHMKQIADSAGQAKMAMDSLGAAFSIGSIVYFTADVIKAGMALEGINRQFAVMAGNADLGARELQFVRETANNLGMDMQGLSSTYSRFMSAVKGTANEGQAGRDAFIGLSEGMVAVGLSADEQSRVWAQLSQGIMKGKFEMEDLKTVQEAGLPIMRLMADSLGITTEQLLDMQKKGQLLVEDVLPKLGASMHNTFGISAKEAAASAQGELARFNNAMLEAKQIAGKALLPMFTDIVKFATPAIASLAKVTQSIQILGIRLAANAAKRGVAWDNLVSGRGMFSKEGLDIQKKAADEADKLAEEMISNILKGSNASTSAYTEQEKSIQKLIKSTTKQTTATSNQTKAAKDHKNAIDEQIKSLKLQLETFGMTSSEVKLWEMDTKGATKAQFKAAEAILTQIDALEKQKTAQEEADKKQIEDQKIIEQNLKNYQSLVRDLRTDEEKYTETIQERIDIMKAAGVTPDADMAAKIVGSGITKAPTFGGVDAAVGGATGELGKIDTAAAELEEWYAAQTEKLELMQELADEEAEIFKAAEDQKLALYKEYTAKKDAIDQTRLKTQEDMRLTSAVSEINVYSSLADSMAQITKNFAGEASTAYKAMFALQKIFAAAMIIANTEIAASKAGAELGIAGIPVSAVIRVAGYASAAMVAGMGLAGMAHDGIDSVPQDGTWLLKKGERVSTAETSAKLDKTLESVSKQNSGGDAPIVNLYEDKSKAGQVESRQQDDRRVIDIWVADLMGDGKAQKAMSRKFGLQPVGA